MTSTLIAVALCGCDTSVDAAASTAPRSSSATHAPRAQPASELRPAALATPVTTGETWKLAALVGQLAAPTQHGPDIGFYGADLGWSFQHGDQLRVLFGDSWRDATGTPIGAQGDDSEGFISLRDYPDGDAVEQHAALSIPHAPPFMGAAPELRMRVNAAGRVAPIALYEHSVDTPELRMSALQVPIAGFSNGHTAFGIFHRAAPLQCSREGRDCPGRFRCDDGLGVCASGDADGYQHPCVLGSQECECRPVAGGGLCQDRGSSQYRADLDVGRQWSVVLEHQVGAQVGTATYVTQPWLTNRFMNAVAKSVRDFDPQRSDPSANDYRPVIAPSPGAKVLLWGRPNFVGIGAAGLDAALYFAYADMPEADVDGSFVWAPRYFTGVVGGVPQFSSDPSDAAPLPLRGRTPGREQVDFVNQMGISYLEPLQRWVMFYGGGAPSLVDGSVTLPDGTHPIHDPRNAVVARYARQPWGPWSAPVEVFAAGDPLATPPDPNSEFASGELLHHVGCRGDACAPGERTQLQQYTPWGFFYAPLIVDAWTEAREGGEAADVYWFVSTWSPYQVVLLKTRLRGSAVISGSELLALP